MTAENTAIPRVTSTSPRAFAKALVMGVLMHDPPVRRTEIFGPLLFDMDERPAPATEFEMLYPGQLEEILFFIGHR